MSALTIIQPKLDFPHVVDSTMLAAAACEMKFYWEWIERKRVQGDSIHLLAGDAIAQALQTARVAYYKDCLDVKTAELLGLQKLYQVYGLREPNESASERSKSFMRVSDAYLQYMDTFPFDKDPFQVSIFNGQPACEFTFTIPSEVKHPTTGDPILIAGRLDWIANKDGTLWTVDEKSSRQRKLEKQGRTLWVLRAQFMCYAYAAHYFGFNVAGVLVREIVLHLEEIHLTTAIVYCEPWRRERWWQWANNRIRRMIAAWERDEYEQNMGELCTQFGGCPFVRLCSVNNPHDWKNVGYVNNDWNPLEKK